MADLKDKKSKRHKITALAGGVGASKLLLGLYAAGGIEIHRETRKKDTTFALS